MSRKGDIPISERILCLKKVQCINCWNIDVIISKGQDKSLDVHCPKCGHDMMVNIHVSYEIKDVTK